MFDTPNEVQTAARPLAGIRVVIVGSRRAGRLLGKLLCDHGATIAHEETVDGSPAGAAAHADVVVDATLDGAVANRQGWDAAAVTRAGLIVCAFDGGSDEAVAAQLGLHRIGGGAPVAEPLPVASTYGAIWGAILVAAALRVRRAGGAGDLVLVSLEAAATTALGYTTLQVDAEPNPYSVPKTPMAEIYLCGDGRYVMNHGLYPRFVQILCSVMGHPEWTEEGVRGLRGLPSQADMDRWRARLEAEFLTRPALEWEEAINAAGGACAMCRTRDEWAELDYPHNAGIFTGGMTRATTLPGPAICVTATDASTQRQRSDTALWPAPSGPADPTLPLAGLRVVDFCIVLAGPTCGRTLAELGADVIAVDDIDRPMEHYTWLDINRSKRSVLIDLKTTDGLTVARDLVASADVVLENYRDGKLAELGLAPEQVRQINPDVIYLSMNTFDYGGAWSHRPGWEHLAQAATGMQVARARDGVPQRVPFPCNDYATGLLGCFGALVALIGRDRGTDGLIVRGSLARTASLTQIEHFTAGGSLPDAAAGLSIPVSDGWVRVIGEPRVEAADIDAESLVSLTASDALARLAGAGVNAVREYVPEELYTLRSEQDGKLFVAWEHPQWGSMRQVAPVFETTAFRVAPRWPAPEPGQDTLEVLAGLGYDQAAVDRLVRRRAVTTTRPLFSL